MVNCLAYQATLKSGGNEINDSLLSEITIVERKALLKKQEREVISAKTAD